MAEIVHPHARLSAPISGPHGEHPVHYRHELIDALRAVRLQGNAALSAIETYDPDLSVKLSACTNEGDVSALLDEWLQRRVTALGATKKRLLEVWQQGQDPAAKALPRIASHHE